MHLKICPVPGTRYCVFQSAKLRSTAVCPGGSYWWPFYSTPFAGPFGSSCFGGKMI